MDRRRAASANSFQPPARAVLPERAIFCLHCQHSDAVAVFGHNLAGMTFEFNDTDSWSSPTIAFAFGVPGGTVVATRYTHEWYTTTNFSGEGYRITRTSGEPWRPHQFKSDPGGQQHSHRQQHKHGRRGVLQAGQGDVRRFAAHECVGSCPEVRRWSMLRQAPRSFYPPYRVV